MGARLNPLSIAITTASDKEMVHSWNYWITTRKSLEEIENDHVFAHIFEPDIEDKEDDPMTWRGSAFIWELLLTRIFTRVFSSSIFGR